MTVSKNGPVIRRVVAPERTYTAAEVRAMLDEQMRAASAARADNSAIYMGEKGGIVIRLGAGWPTSLYGDQLAALVEVLPTAIRFARESGLVSKSGEPIVWGSVAAALAAMDGRTIVVR